MHKKPKSIKLVLDTRAPLEKVRTMNMLAEVVRILHQDPEVGVLRVDVKDDGKNYQFIFRLYNEAKKAE